MNIKKAIKAIFVDFLGLIIGVINGFILPKYLSIESYAYIKMFTLYVSYSGVFNMGFCDGMYIYLGGKKFSDIKKSKISGYLICLIKIAIITTIFLIVASMFLIKNVTFKFFIMYTFPYQVAFFFLLLYRATGQIDKYTFIKILINIFNLLSVIGAVIWFNIPYIYMIIQILGYIIIAFIYLTNVFKQKEVEKIEICEIKKMINMGFVVMIANTVNNLFFSLDRWFIKFRFPIEDFAYYSFGVSMLNLFLTLINSITILFYPYLAKCNGNSIITNMIKRYIIIITGFVPAGYFILEFIVSKFIDNYINSLDILGILILTIPFITLINVLYTNLYKALNKGRMYLFTAIKMLIISSILNTFVLFVCHKSVSIAYATLISLIFWYIYSSKHFEGLSIERKEYVYFGIYIFAYIIIKNLNILSISKCVIFSIIAFLNAFILYRNEVSKILKYIKNSVKNFK